MKIFCSGIGGIGLSAYAALMNAAGHEVSGSDKNLSPLTHDLEEQGIPVTDRQDGSAVPEDADLFVYSEAIPADAPERKKADMCGIRLVSYFAALGEMSTGKRVIAVCGTHGKSSTTAMAAKVLIDAGLDPTVVVGTKVRDLQGRNWRKGESDLFLLEACEYRGSFLYLDPSIILMTNVDGDHFDAYPTIEDYRKAFANFLARLPARGVVVTHGSDRHCAALARESKRSVIDADTYPLPELSIPGRHMRENGQLVVALAQHLGVPWEGPLRAFAGTWRRMEVKGETAEGVTVIDDYAHHPAEIAATIAGIREGYPGRRIVCLFQPHMHDRTIRLYNDFLVAFEGADMVVTTDVYDARPDVEAERVDMRAFTADIRTESTYGGSLKDAEHLLRSKILQRGDVLIVMGAGDVTKVADAMLKH